jgi:hypothetical protein
VPKEWGVVSKVEDTSLTSIVYIMFPSVSIVLAADVGI